MKEMYCKLCGYRGGAGESQCPDCGAPLFEAQADLPTETAPVSDEVNITKKRRGRLRLTRPALIAGFLALCLAVQGVGLWRLHRPVDPGWSFVDIQSDRLVTSQGVWSFGDVEVGGADGNDGPCRVIWTWNRNYDGSSVDLGVYFYDGKSLEKTDWTSATISGNGQALFYQTGQEGEEQTITRRDLKTGRETEVARGLGVSIASVCDYAGTALTYYKEDPACGDPAQGYARRCLWQLGVGSREVEGHPYYLGKHGDNYLTFLHDEDESADEFRYGGSTTAVVWNGGERTTRLPRDMKADRELTEILYQDDEGWWNYENQDGLAKRLEDLPRNSGLDTVRRSGDAYSTVTAHLTGQVYQAIGGGLYYLAQDLSVTRLTAAGTVSQAQLTADGQTLYYTFRPSGQPSEFWRQQRTDAGDWEAALLTPSGGNVQDYLLSPDGQTLCARCWDGNGLAWKLQVWEDQWETLEGIKGHATSEEVLLLDGGGCWYQGDSSSLHRELWYRAPDGETQLKMSYTSPLSSTMYPDEAEVPLGMDILLGLQGFELIDLGRGDQALLRVRYLSGDDTKGKTLYSSAYTPEAGETDYWLLEDDGTMTKLEAIEP